MSSDEDKKEEKKRKKQEKAQRLRKRQEEALKKAHEEEEKNASAKKKEETPQEMISKGYTISSEEIASGQFSNVFKGKLKDEDIVVRVVKKDDKEESFVKTQIPRFVRVLCALDERHPNIVDILDIFETSKRVIIMMRFAQNGTLYDFLDKESNPPEENVCRKWAQQLVSALSYLHINGIVHRDLRAEKIYLDENQSLKISGFTYSRLWVDVKSNAILLSNTCIGIGPYSAPETLSGEKYDPRTADVWAFGVVVFFIWNKGYPFDYNMTHKLVSQQRSYEWKNRLRTETSDLLKEYFNKTFEINHNQRQQIVDFLNDKWIDSKVKVVLNESLKAFDENTNKDITKDKKSDNKEDNNNKQKEKENKSNKKEDKQKTDIKKESNDNTDNEDVIDSDDDDDDEDSDDSKVTKKGSNEDTNKDNTKTANISVKKGPKVSNVLTPDLFEDLKKAFLCLQ